MGRLSLFTPLIWLFFAPAVSRGGQALSARPDLKSLFMWAMMSLMLGGLSLNQFGFDRGAVKGLFLLPLSTTQILYGKSLCFGVVLLVECAAFAVLVGVLAPQPAPFLVAGAAMALTVGGLQLLIGQWTSLVWPRPIPRRGLKQPPASVVFSLVVLTIFFGTMLPLGVLWWVIGGTSPWGLAGVMVALLVVVWGLHPVFTPLAARVLALRREHLVENLS
jgi:hypothetical protein